MLTVEQMRELREMYESAKTPGMKSFEDFLAEFDEARERGRIHAETGRAARGVSVRRCDLPGERFYMMEVADAVMDNLCDEGDVVSFPNNSGVRLYSIVRSVSRDPGGKPTGFTLSDHFRDALCTIAADPDEWRQ